MVIQTRVERDTYADSVRLMHVAQALRGLPGVQAADALIATPRIWNAYGRAACCPTPATPPGQAICCSACAPPTTPPPPRRSMPRSCSCAARVRRPVSAKCPARRPPGGHRARAGRRPRRRLRARRPRCARGRGRAARRPARLPVLRQRTARRRSAPEDASRRARPAADGPRLRHHILAGVGLGFANAVAPAQSASSARRAPGSQQVSCLLDAAGVGVSHAIGTGGRDLAEGVGGRTIRRALALLAADPATRVIVLISKPPRPRWRAPSSTRRQPRQTGGRLPAGCRADPTAAGRHLGAHSGRRRRRRRGAGQRAELAEVKHGYPRAARISLVGSPSSAAGSASAGGVIGLFAGGTLAQEALLLLRKRLGAVASNLDGSLGGRPRTRSLTMAPTNSRVAAPIR